MEKTQSRISISHSHSTPFSNAVLHSWGRVLAAAGSVRDLSKPLDPTRVNVLFVPDDGSPALPVLVGGEPENVDEVRALEILSGGKFEIKIELGIGEETAKYWTCDFSYVSLSFLLNFSLEGASQNPARWNRGGPSVSSFRLFCLCFLFPIAVRYDLRLWILNFSAVFRLLWLFQEYVKINGDYRT